MKQGDKMIIALIDAFYHASGCHQESARNEAAALAVYRAIESLSDCTEDAQKMAMSGLSCWINPVIIGSAMLEQVRYALTRGHTALRRR